MVLSDTRTQKDTLDVFGGEYPGGALYTKSAWIAAHPKETQALTNAIVATLKWIHSHTPEEIMAKMPEELVGADKALYLAALKNTLPMYSQTGKMDPKGAKAVLDVFSQSSSDVAYGRVGNDAAVFPLQRLGIEVWPVHTVQFSNHTGYGSWKGSVFDANM